MVKGPKYQKGFIQFVQAAMAVGSLVAGAKKKKAEKKARRAQQLVNQIKNVQAFRSFMSDFLQANAVAEAQGIIGGAQDSSFSQATLASQGTQARVANVEFRKQQELGATASAQMDKAARLGMASDLLSVGSSFVGSDAFASFFPKGGNAGGGGGGPLPTSTKALT